MSTLLSHHIRNFAGMQSSFRPKQVAAIDNSNSFLKRAKEASFAGVICFLLPFMFTFFCFAKDIFLDAFTIYLNVMISCGLFFRVVTVNWVSNVILEQGRDIKSWQILSFLLPSIALLILGQQGKKRNAAIPAQDSIEIISEAEVIEYIYEFEGQLLRKAN